MTLFAVIFGGGSVDVFYIDKIEKGVKKYVTDKDRKKELAGYFKEYQAAYKMWNKELKLDIKQFKTRNLDRGATIEWYYDFFESRVEERVELQAKYIAIRLNLQGAITDNEWSQIMAMSAEADQKQEEEEAKAERKRADKDFLKKLRETTDVNVQDPVARKELQLTWDIFEKEYGDIGDAFDYLDVNHSSTLSNRNATEVDLEAVAVILNELRTDALKGYIPMIEMLKANTNDEEYTAVMKEFNKLLK